MSTLRRIATLHRELAEAYDRLDEDRRGKLKTRVRKAIAAQQEETMNEVVDNRVRRGLRKLGMKVKA